MWDLGGEGVGSSASALPVATMCKGDAGPLVNKYLQISTSAVDAVFHFIATLAPVGIP